MKGKPSYLLTWLRIPPGPCYETQCSGSFILLSYISLYGNQQAKRKKKKIISKNQRLHFFVLETTEAGAEYSFLPGVNLFHFNLQSDAIKEKIK